MEPGVSTLGAKSEDPFSVPEGELRIAHPPHEPRSSRREEAHSSSGKGSQSLLTSAATVQRFNARRFAWENSFKGGTLGGVPPVPKGRLNQSHKQRSSYSRL